jgi:U3 small nucleolar RNA-associated protein 21
MWNMQSGLKRKKFDVGPCPPGVSSRFNIRVISKKQTEHRSVTGLATDALNRLVIASTLDGTVNVGNYCTSRRNPLTLRPQFFDFHTTRLEETLVLPSAATSILLHRDSGLLAVVCDDLAVRIVDIETRRIVRELKGFRGRVLDTVRHSIFV